MRTTTTAAAINAALATGTLAALAAAVKATGVDADTSCGKSMRAALTAWLDGDQTATPAVPAPTVMRMNTDNAPATVPAPVSGKVTNPVQGATGVAKCYLRSCDGKVYTPANGVQALAHAVSTATTVAELEALASVFDQLVGEAEDRLTAQKASKPAAPKADKPAVPPQSIRMDGETTKPAAAAQTVKPAADAVAPKASKPAAKKASKGKDKPAAPKADGLAAYRKLVAECKALGLSTKGKADELTARIAAAKQEKANKPAPKADSQTVKPAADAGFTPKTLNRLEAMADALGVRLADLVAAAELTGVKLS